MIRELTPCLTILEIALLALSHQSRKEFSVGCGDKARRPTCRSKINQWKHIQPGDGWLFPPLGHKVGSISARGIPRCARQSDVQHLLCATNHMKKRHFGGAQVFQILSHGAKRVAPKKKHSYAALNEYWPFEENLPICFWLYNNVWKDIP